MLERLKGLFAKKHLDVNTKHFEENYSSLVERLENIRAGFDMAVDDETIEALIYEENAVLARLSRLYKDARASGIRLEPYTRERYTEKN